MRKAEIITAFLLGLFSLSIMWKSGEGPSWDPDISRFDNIGFIDGEGPGSGFWPFWLSFLMFICCVWIAYNWYKRTSPPSQSDAPFLDYSSTKLLFLVVSGLIGFLLSIFIVGFYGAIFLFGFVLISIFLIKAFFILETSKPPNLSILGLFTRSIIVDSSPILHFPPSKIYLILSPKSSLTSDACTALNLVEIFALGAATG